MLQASGRRQECEASNGASEALEDLGRSGNT